MPEIRTTQFSIHKIYNAMLCLSLKRNIEAFKKAYLHCWEAILRYKETPYFKRENMFFNGQRYELNI